MRYKVILLLTFFVLLIFGCTPEEYEIIIINKSSYPIDFEFTTGHRLGEYRLNPGDEWHYSLLKSLGHSMGSFKPITSSTNYVDFRYSDYVYTFHDAYRLTFNGNGGSLKKDQKALATLTVIKNELTKLPNGGEIWENWNSTEGRPSVFGGWSTNTSGTGTVYLIGQSYFFNSNSTLYAKWE